MNVTLSAKTHKGKNRINEHGNKWHVLRVVSEALPFSKGDSGPWLFLESKKTLHTRWVRESNDIDFFVED
jgi:hypothetical protein